MRLGKVQPGDIIKADGHLGYVDAKDGQEVLVHWVGSMAIGRVTSRQITAHWRLVKAASPTRQKA